MAAVSTGAAVGIAIGCLVAGVLVCGLAFYLYLHRRTLLRSRKSNIGRDVDGEEETLGEKQRSVHFHADRVNDSPVPDMRRADEQHPRSNSTSSTSTATIGTIETIDQEVREQFHCLNIAIKGHSELYYNLRAIDSPDEFKKISCDTNVATLGDLLGPYAPLSAVAMDILLQTPETRHEAIRLLLAWTLFRFIQADAPIERSLLPPELVRCAQAMARQANENAAAQQHRRRSAAAFRDPATIRCPSPLKSHPGIGASNRQQAQSSITPSAACLRDEHLSFAKWRSMSGKLFAPIYGDGSMTRPPCPASSAFPPTTPASAAGASDLTREPDAREKNINDLITALVCLLQPYVAKGYGGARVRDLENVIKSAAGFGYKLFTQKTEWEFAWSTLMADELVVFPALVKIGDDRGHRLRQSIVLTWEETVRLEEDILDVVRKREVELRTIREDLEEA